MKYRHIINLLLLSIPTCVLLRLIQLVFTIDNTTGFAKQQYSQISLLITVVVCAVAIAIGTLASAADDIVESQKTVQPLTAVASMFTAGMFVYEMVGCASAWSVSSTRAAILVVLSLLSAVTFAAFALKNIYDYRFPAIMLVLPTVFYVVKLVTLFISTSALALVTNNVFMLFANASVLLFMYEFACFENGFRRGSKSFRKLFSIGIVAVILCCVTALPPIILTAFGKWEMLKGDIASSLLLIAQAVFTFVYMSQSFYKKQKRSSRHVSKHSA